MVRARGVDAVLIAHNLPKLGTNLVAALAALNVDDLTHGCRWSGAGLERCSLRLQSTPRHDISVPVSKIDQCVSQSVWST